MSRAAAAVTAFVAAALVLGAGASSAMGLRVAASVPSAPGPRGHAGSAKKPAKSAAPASKASAHGAKRKHKTIAKKPPAPPPLDGTTYDYAYDGKDIGHKERAWLGRAFVHKKAAADPSKALPLLVFVHGLNSEQIKYRWMGGGNEGDVRRIVAEMIENGSIPPVLVAAPSSVLIQNIGVAVTSWMGFDLDHFVDKTAEALKGAATIDRTKIIVAGHSGGGCNAKGGIATASKAKNVHTVISIDTCMGSDLATALAAAKKSTNVVVTWQSISWQDRPIKDFKSVFEREVKKAPADSGVLRTLDAMTPKEPMPHDAMVKATLTKYLPLLVPPPKAAAPSASATPSSSSAPSTSSAPSASSAPAPSSPGGGDPGAKKAEIRP